MNEMMPMQVVKTSSPIRPDRNFDMPSVPIVLTKILQLVDDDRASARRLEELIQHDPSLSVRILKLSNSAFYSFRSEVRTISHAISLLGLNLVRSLTIGVSIFESFTRGMKEQAGQINQLWMHSFAVGLISQEIWNRRSTRAQGEFALLCGLLHDMGKIVFFKKDPAAYSRIFALKRGPEDPDICTIEMENYGEDHAQLGAALIQRWNLPPELATAVLHHHAPDACGRPLIAAVSMADWLTTQAGIGSDGDRRGTPALPAHQELLKMQPDEFNALSAMTQEKRADVEEFFRHTL
jgi:putative nucleotidyltransferase with HDIG domain